MLPGNSTHSGTQTRANGTITDMARYMITNNGLRTADTTYDNTATEKTTTVDKTVSNGSNGSEQVNTSFTGPNGKTATSDQTYNRAADGYTKNGTVVGPNGKVGKDDVNVTVSKGSNGATTRAAVGTIAGPHGVAKTINNTETSTKTFAPVAASTSTASTID